MRRPSLDAVRGFERPVYVVALGRLINVFGSGLVYPFATVHFHLELGIALSVVGVGLLANNVTTALGTAVGGYLSDGYGRKPVMVASMTLSTATLSAYAFVPGIAAATPLSLGNAFVAVAALAGVATGLYAPASQAMIADLTAAGERERGYAMLKVASNAGFGSGFVVGGVLYGFVETSVFVADGLTSGVVAVLLFFLVPRVSEGAASASTSFRDSIGDWGRAVSRPRVLGLAALNVGFAVMYAQMQATVPVVAAEDLGLSSSQLGTLYVLNPLTIVVAQLPLVAAVERWRRTRGLLLSTAFWASAMLAVWVVPWAPRLLGVTLVGAFLVLRTVGEIFHSPLVTSLASDLGTSAERGTQLSLLEIAKRLGFGLGAAVGGWFFDAGLQDLLWPTLVAGCVAIAVGLVVLERHVTPAENGVV